ncbi:integrating conjugative element protein family [Methylocaldum marinum]|uniref:Integrating conjugative element protein family n=1 Tax=Methylocaldum marinum TaxID=1432792 RepID=A0A250KRS5_9GAMM|nr:integrating conjugative element protein family [Methylocaldum marinum]
MPRNATLIGSTGMTALIGRIPIKGQVEDPYPLKVIVGSDNLAANGLEIPGVDGMIFSGTAIGDWALSCVRGTLHSVTFVFDDGTIRTLSSDDQGVQRKEQQSAQAQGARPPPPGRLRHRQQGHPAATGGGPTMREVYDAHFEKTRQRRTEGARRERGVRGPGHAAVSLDGWTREAHSEIQQLFPRLPNPDLVLYVFPHLSPQGHPVPGYATSFPMYETVEYALPGEAEGW